MDHITIGPARPQEFKYDLQGQKVSDWTDLLQLGGANINFFHGLQAGNFYDISWGPLFRIVVGLKSDLIQINRKTESLLDVLSSCGGLMRALTIIAQILIKSYNTYALKSLLADNLVRFVPSQSANSANATKK